MVRVSCLTIAIAFTWSERREWRVRVLRIGGFMSLNPFFRLILSTVNREVGLS
ncbi:MAG: hypothetical protein PVH50_00460 [Anaerolineae bacterium]|jgi:hypothetical protein